MYSTQPYQDVVRVLSEVFQLTARTLLGKYKYIQWSFMKVTYHQSPPGRAHELTNMLNRLRVMLFLIALVHKDGTEPVNFKRKWRMAGLGIGICESKIMLLITIIPLNLKKSAPASC